MIKLFTDTADYDSIKKAAQDQSITGFTTNPTLMKQAGITDYVSFSRLIIAHLARTRPDTCLSLEVFADDHDNMYRQATIISGWGNLDNYPVYVKIPIMNTKGESNYGLIRELVMNQVKVNVTALFTYEQITKTIDVLDRNIPTILSVFAGRIADAGTDPCRIITDSIDYLKTTGSKGNVEFLWASSREAYNYKQAEQSGCDIITMTPDLIKKVKGFGKDLQQFSLETVQMFYNDATASGYTL